MEDADYGLLLVHIVRVIRCILLEVQERLRQRYYAPQSLNCSVSLEAVFGIELIQNAFVGHGLEDALRVV